jgi:hypothetical protein
MDFKGTSALEQIDKLQKALLAGVAIVLVATV